MLSNLARKVQPLKGSPGGAFMKVLAGRVVIEVTKWPHPKYPQFALDGQLFSQLDAVLTFFLYIVTISIYLHLLSSFYEQSSFISL